MPSKVVRVVLVLVAALGPLAGLSNAARASAPTGPWNWPLTGAGAVSRPFVAPPHRYGVGHRGADLLAAPGTAVVAAGAGRISYAGLLAGRGVVVVVHGALRTTYEPVRATVGVGARVAAGQVIGTLDAGHAGCPAAACLHWGLRRGEDYLDPVRLVERRPVRLLPVAPLPGASPATAAAPLPGAPPATARQRTTSGDGVPPGSGLGGASLASAGGATPVAARLDPPAAALALSAGAALTAVAVRRRAR